VHFVWKNLHSSSNTAGTSVSQNPNKNSSLWTLLRISPIFSIGFAFFGLIGLLFAYSFIVGLVNAKAEADREIANRPIVYNSSFDGSVAQVKEYIKDNAKNPRTLQFSEWSPVQQTGTGFIVRCKYRGENSFGGMAVENQIFFLDSQGTIINVADF
jgi:hypothetical protein